jgi:hypothetical protein
MNWLLSAICLSLAAPAPTAGGVQLTLTASTAQPYLGEEVELTLDLVLPQALAEKYASKKPAVGLPRLTVPFLQAEEFKDWWSVPPEEWARRHAKPNGGLPLAVNDGPAPVWAAPVKPTAAEQSAGRRRYRLTWRFVTREPHPALEGRIPLRVRLDGVPAGEETAALTLLVQELPRPPRELPKVFLGVGTYRLEVSVQPAQVTLGETVTVTLTLTGAGPLREVRRPVLARLPGWDRPDDLLVENGLESGSQDGQVRRFIYYVRPRHTNLHALPPVRYASFDPQRKAYIIEETPPLPLSVRPPDKPAAVPRRPYPPGAVPDRLQPTGLSAESLQPAAVWPSRAVLLAVLLVPPLACGALWLWRWRLGVRAGGELARRASSAAGAALRMLRHADAEQVGAAVLAYLERRWHITLAEPTPAEVAQALREVEVPAPTIAAAEELVRRWDAARFAPLDVPLAELRDRVERLIRELDEVP